MAPGSNPYAVLFDIDGTLLLTGGAGQRSFVKTFREDFQIDEPQGDISFSGRSDRAIAHDLMQINGVDPTPANWDRFLTGYCRRIDETLTECPGSLLPGVLDLLDHIAQQDHVVLGLLTGNVEAGAWAKLRHYGLADRFAFGGFGDQHTCRNDIAAAALQAAGQHVEANSIGSAAEICGAMVVGDTVNDILCARSIGAFAVAVATGFTPAEELRACGPDLLLEDLTRPEALLAEIHAAGAV